MRKHWLGLLLMPLLYGLSGYLLIMFAAAECDRNSAICKSFDPWIWPFTLITVPVVSILSALANSKNSKSKIWLSIWSFVATSFVIFFGFAHAYVLFQLVVSSRDVSIDCICTSGAF